MIGIVIRSDKHNHQIIDRVKAKLIAIVPRIDRAEDVLQVLTYAKAAGYELDNIAAVETGRDLLAGGVIAAENMDNLALGLRLLTAASKAEGCAPDSGDYT